MDTGTVWGQVPAIPLQVTNAFSSNVEDSLFQDVGYDGLSDTAEKRKFAPYLNSLASILVQTHLFIKMHKPIHQEIILKHTGMNHSTKEPRQEY